MSYSPCSKAITKLMLHMNGTDSACSRSRTEGFCFPQKAGVRLPPIFQLPLLVIVSTVRRCLFLCGMHQQEPQGFGLAEWWRLCNGQTPVPRSLSWFLHQTEPCPCNQWAPAVWATLSHRRWLLGQTLTFWSINFLKTNKPKPPWGSEKTGEP